MAGIRQILFRRGTQTDWELTNPITSEGEPTYDKTRHRQKIGDGVTPWADLPSILTMFYREQTADQTVNASVALVNSTYLLVPAPAGSKWLVKLGLVFQAATAADFRFNVYGPTGFTRGKLGFIGPAQAVTATSGDAQWNTAVAYANDAAIGGAAAGTDMSAMAWTTVLVGATAGNIGVQFAQRVSDASNTILRVGSVAEFLRVL